jgi:dihydroorotate dehydrogenase electron transfer subunit
MKAGSFEVTTAIVKPARLQLRFALAELLSIYSNAKGLQTGGKLCRGGVGHPERVSTRARSSREHGAFPEPDLIWLHKGRPSWKFYMLPDAQVSHKLTPKLGFAGSVIICVDPSDNLGFIEPAMLIEALAESFASIDSLKVRSLARDVSAAPVPRLDSQFDGLVLENKQFIKDHFSLRMRTGLVRRPVPGQFLQVMCDPAPHAQSPRYRRHSCSDRRWPKLRGVELLGQRPFLRRPFSVASYGPSSPRTGSYDLGHPGMNVSRLVNWMEPELDVVYRRLPEGPGTSALAKYETGDKINIVGPLGKGFTLSPPPKVALLVGGGIGAPPLNFLAEELLNSGVEVRMFLGAVTRSRLPFELRGVRKDKVKKFARMRLNHVVCTDDGSVGRKGLVTQPLAEYLESHRDSLGSSRIFACGPRPMLAALSGLANHYDIPCEALLEERMACGFGACISCVCAVKERGQKARFTRICTEGPAFDVRTVMWHA